MKRTNDPMGTAIAEYHNTGHADTLRVFSPHFDEDEIPVHHLFRTYSEMPLIEQQALQMSQGHILDVGAGAGCHSLALQQMHKDVTAIDISPLSVETMSARGVHRVIQQDFFIVSEQYDTILMLMNGIGIVGTIDRLPAFFRHIERILTPHGQLLLDSSDISYVFEDEDGIIYLPQDDRYYGELDYQMQYNDIKGASFPWLYIDFQALQDIAGQNGFHAQLILQGEHHQYLARITRI